MDASSSVELTDPSAIIQVRSKLRWEWFHGLKCCENAPPPHLPCSVPSHTPPTLHAKHRCFRNCRENVSRYVYRSRSQGACLSCLVEGPAVSTLSLWPAPALLGGPGKIKCAFIPFVSQSTVLFNLNCLLSL